MNTTTSTTTSERTKKTRENQQKRLDHVRELLTIANSNSPATPGARLELIMLLCKAVSYHNSGKIEGLHSLDTACSNNEFCPKMQRTPDPAIICGYCYTESMWEAARFAHHITGEILSGMELTTAEAAMITIPALKLRFNSDGELINYTHARNLIRIAATHPATTFSLWAKRPGILNPVIIEEHKPVNLILGVSSPMINVPFRERWTWCDFIFTVYTPAGMVQALARGEHECNGRKCLECGFYCYNHHDTSAGPVYVAEALRKPKGVSVKDFPAVIAAIDAATLDK